MQPHVECEQCSLLRRGPLVSHSVRALDGAGSHGGGDDTARLSVGWIKQVTENSLTGQNKDNQDQRYEQAQQKKPFHLIHYTEQHSDSIFSPGFRLQRSREGKNQCDLRLVGRVFERRSQQLTWRKATDPRIQTVTSR